MPYYRFGAKVREVVELREQLEALTAERDELIAAHETTINEMKQAQAQEVLAVRKRLDEARALELEMEEPDQDAVDTARKHYEAIPEPKRPASIVDWWKGLDEKTTPKTLRAYRKTVAETVEDGAEPVVKKAETRPVITTPRGSRPSGKITTEQILDPSSDVFSQIFPKDS